MNCNYFSDNVIEFNATASHRGSVEFFMYADFYIIVHAYIILNPNNLWFTH